jgi:hypothetical protein
MVDPGEHDFLFQAEGGGAASVHVLLRAGDRNRLVNAEFPPLPADDVATAPPAVPGGASASRIATSLAVLGAGVASLAIGAGFSVASGNDSARASSIRSGVPSSFCTGGSSEVACTNLAHAVDDQRRDATIGTVGYIAGGGLAVAAAILWYVWPHPRASASGFALLPGVDGGDLGLTTTLRW